MLLLLKSTAKLLLFDVIIVTLVGLLSVPVIAAVVIEWVSLRSSSFDRSNNSNSNNNNNTPSTILLLLLLLLIAWLPKRRRRNIHKLASHNEIANLRVFVEYWLLVVWQLFPKQSENLRHKILPPFFSILFVGSFVRSLLSYYIRSCFAKKRKRKPKPRQKWKWKRKQPKALLVAPFEGMEPQVYKGSAAARENMLPNNNNSRMQCETCTISSLLSLSLSLDKTIVFFLSFWQPSEKLSLLWIKRLAKLYSSLSCRFQLFRKYLSFENRTIPMIVNLQSKFGIFWKLRK